MQYDKYQAENFNQHISRFGKVVVWGLRREYHTHRYIHKGFYETLKKLGRAAVWTDYKADSSVIQKGDLVISSSVSGRGVKDCTVPILPDVYYCLHNYGDDVVNQVDSKHRISLQVYTNPAEQSDQKWDESTFFNTKTQTLYQAWGTNLMPWEFLPPTFNKHKSVFWIGSVWNNALNQGNIKEIAELKDVLQQHSLKFRHVRFVPDWVNVKLIRYSRLAPAIAGRWQVENNYLPCRMFKNISYGGLGFSNVKKFSDLFGSANIVDSNIAGLTDQVLSLPQKQYLEIIKRQQEVVKLHTYMNKLLNICKALDIINALKN